MKPTLFVDDIESRYPENPVVMALKLLASASGATVVEQLVAEDVEADIAITDTAAKALRMVKGTERTTIVVFYFGREAGEQAVAFASRFPERVRAFPLVEATHESENALTILQRLVAEKAKEV